jgi:hypothetical protein
VGDQSHRKVDAELSRPSQNLERTEGVELVQSIEDHDVGEHDLSVEEVLVNFEFHSEHRTDGASHETERALGAAY